MKREFLKPEVEVIEIGNDIAINTAGQSVNVRMVAPTMVLPSDLLIDDGNQVLGGFEFVDYTGELPSDAQLENDDLDYQWIWIE